MIDGSLNTFLKHYEDQEWIAAEKSLMENKDNISKPLFHYNLGVLRVKQSKFVDARYNFELSKELGYSNLAVNKNIDVTVDSLQLTKLEKASSIGEYINIGIVNINYDILYLIMGVTLIITLVSLLKSMSRMITASAGLILLVLLYVSFLYKPGIRSAIVKSGSSLSEGPTNALLTNAEIPAGLKVILEKEADNWYFISAPKSFVGWVNKENLLFIK